MRSSTLLSLAAAVLLAGLPHAAAAQFGMFEVGVGGGPSFPAQEFNDEGDTGYHLQGSLGWRPPVLPVGLRADALWQSFPDDVDGSFRQIAGFVGAFAELPALVVRPYGLAGVGLVGHGVPDEEHAGHVHADDGDTDVGFQIGAGLRLGLPGINAFVEARYLDMGEEYAAVPITVGLLF